MKLTVTATFVIVAPAGIPLILSALGKAVPAVLADKFIVPDTAFAPPENTAGTAASNVAGSPAHTVAVDGLIPAGDTTEFTESGVTVMQPVGNA